MPLTAEKTRNSFIPVNTIAKLGRALVYGTKCNIGLPLNGQSRPYLSNTKPEEKEKIRADLEIVTTLDFNGEDCFLFRLGSTQKYQKFKLPISYAAPHGQPPVALTEHGDQGGEYNYIEAVVRRKNGEFLVRAGDGNEEPTWLNTEVNRVPKDFVNKILEIATEKLSP